MRVQTDENSHKFSVEIYSDFVAFVISRDPGYVFNSTCHFRVKKLKAKTINGVDDRRALDGVNKW